MFRPFNHRQQFPSGYTVLTFRFTQGLAEVGNRTFRPVDNLREDTTNDYVAGVCIKNEWFLEVRICKCGCMSS
jgi:hypothetical protein